MIRKIYTIDDLKIELMRYFAVMRALPYPKKPGYAKNYLWALAKFEHTEDYLEADNVKMTITAEDVADCWFICDNWMPCLTKFEYSLLARRLAERPVPWKIIAHQHHSSRQMLNIYLKKALYRLFNQVREGINPNV